MKRCDIVAVLLFALACLNAAAKDVLFKGEYPVPAHYQLFNDHGGLLSVSEGIRINRKLEALERRNGTQIVFLSVPDTGTLTAVEYGSKVASAWALGNNGHSNGALLLVVMATGQYAIVTGAGIGGALPDVAASRILREKLAPHFAKEDYSAGVEAALDAMVLAARGEDTAPTFYTYINAANAAFDDEHTRSKMIACSVLIGFGLLYALALLWRRFRQRRATT